MRIPWRFCLTRRREATLRTLRLGSQGDRVRQLQSRLIDLKLLSDDADGVYGDNTEAAVRLFQQRMIQLGLSGLSLDGVATPGLVDLLMSDLSVYGFEAPIYFDESTPLALSEDDLYSKACIVMEALHGKRAVFPMRPIRSTIPPAPPKS